MKESIIFRISNIYRDDFRIRAFTFGEGEKALCIVGSSRGNEYQQLYTCSRVLQRLKKLEAQGRFAENRQVMVIPTVNPASMNIGKRFWCIDNTDINRMFPGYALGETTQRIAGAIFEIVNKYPIGIQFTSFYMPGEFQPYVQMIHTGYEDPEKARGFGLPYIVVREPRPYDTATLNYNWQIWETDAYSIYSGTTAEISALEAELAVDAVERFMICSGIECPYRSIRPVSQSGSPKRPCHRRTGAGGNHRSLHGGNSRNHAESRGRHDFLPLRRSAHLRLYLRLQDPV